MTEQDPRELVRELDALAEKATPGTWTWEQDRLGGCTLYSGRTAAYHGLNLLGRMDPDGHGEANLDFITALRNAYPALRAAVLRVAELEELLRDVRAHLHQPGFDDCDGKDSCPWSAEHAIVARMDAAISASPAQGEEGP